MPSAFSSSPFLEYILLWSLVLILHCNGQSIVKPCDENQIGLRLCKIEVPYDKTFPSNPPMYINQSITVYDVVDFNPEQQTVTIFLQLYIWWKDTRLTLASSDPNMTMTKDNWLFLDTSVAQELFFPKMKKIRVKNIQQQRLYGPTTSNYFWFQFPHHLEYLETLKVEFYCSFDFTNFPFDQHKCNINFGSLGVSIKYIRLSPTKIIYSGNSTKFGGKMMKISSTRIPFDMKVESTEPFNILDAGYNYSHAGFKLYFYRNEIGGLLSGFYLPTGLLAIMSMISFGINPEVVPGRLGLLVTLYLITSNIYNAIIAPTTRGYSYIEVWMSGIQITILLAIFEYGFVLSCMKFIGKQKMDDIDKWTFCVALTFFIIFNLYYWSSISQSGHFTQ